MKNNELVIRQKKKRGQPKHIISARIAAQGKRGLKRGSWKGEESKGGVVKGRRVWEGDGKWRRMREGVRKRRRVKERRVREGFEK